MKSGKVEDELDKEIERRRKRKKELATKRLNKCSIRRNELQEALKKYGLQIRDDSKLCHGYIDGSLKDWSLNDVVDMCRQMNWLFTHTNYEKRVHENIQAEYKYNGQCDTADVAEYIRRKIIKNTVEVNHG